MIKGQYWSDDVVVINSYNLCINCTRTPADWSVWQAELNMLISTLWIVDIHNTNRGYQQLLIPVIWIVHVTVWAELLISAIPIIDNLNWIWISNCLIAIGARAGCLICSSPSRGHWFRITSFQNSLKHMHKIARNCVQNVQKLSAWVGRKMGETWELGGEGERHGCWGDRRPCVSPLSLWVWRIASATPSQRHRPLARVIVWNYEIMRLVYALLTTG